MKNKSERSEKGKKKKRERKKRMLGDQYILK